MLARDFLKDQGNPTSTPLFTSLMAQIAIRGGAVAETGDGCYLLCAVSFKVATLDSGRESEEALALQPFLVSLRALITSIDEQDRLVLRLWSTLSSEEVHYEYAVTATTLHGPVTVPV